MTDGNKEKWREEGGEIKSDVAEGFRDVVEMPGGPRYLAHAVLCTVLISIAMGREIYRYQPFVLGIVVFFLVVTALPILYGYHRENQLLVGLLLADAVLKVLLASILLMKISPRLAPLSLIVPIITLWLAKEVAEYRGNIYRSIAFLVFLGLGQTLSYAEKIHSPIAITVTALYYLLWVVITGLSIHLAHTLFPTLSFTGVKQRPAGNYLFD